MIDWKGAFDSSRGLLSISRHVWTFPRAESRLSRTIFRSTKVRRSWIINAIYFDVIKRWPENYLDTFMFICRRYLLLLTSFFIGIFAKFKATVARSFTWRIRAIDTIYSYLWIIEDCPIIFPALPIYFTCERSIFFIKTTWRGPSDFHHRNITHTRTHRDI